MRNTNDDKELRVESKNILVIGSKPNSSYFPANYSAVISANGAAKLLDYIQCPVKIAIISSAAAQSEFIRDILSHSSPSEIILRCHGTSDYESIKSGFAHQYAYVGRSMAGFEREAYGIRVYHCYIKTFLYASCPKKFLASMIRHMRGSYRAFACSTGLWAIAFALHHFPNHKIHVTGISLKYGGHFHGNQTGDFQGLTAEKDRILASQLSKYSLTTTDRNFSLTSGATLLERDLIAFPNSF